MATDQTSVLKLKEFAKMPFSGSLRLREKKKKKNIIPQRRRDAEKYKNKYFIRHGSEPNICQ